MSIPNTPVSNAVFQLEGPVKLPKHYELGPLLGEGAFSCVYQAKNTITGQDVAIKVINKQNLSEKQLANISNEIHVMNTLANAGRHPNILRLLEAIHTDVNCFIVLELCDGGEIFNKIIEYTYFSERLSSHVFLQLLEAVRFMHENHIVHRDIKPENLLFDTIPFQPRSEEEARAALRSSDDDVKKDEGKFVPGVGGGCIGTIKLADFGLARQLKYDLLATKRASNLKTPCGTAGYTAPEVIHCGVETKRRFKSLASKSNYYSKAVDIWSLGCFLYTVLCGFPPFYDENHAILTQKIINADFVFLEPWWDEVSAEAKDLISQMLVVNPEERITIDEIFAHPWMADVVAPEASGYFPDHTEISNPNASSEASTEALRVMYLHKNHSEPFKTPQGSRPSCQSPFRRAATPTGLARALVSPGIAIKQVFNNPAMSHMNIKLMAQFHQRYSDVKLDDNAQSRVGTTSKIPRTPAPKNISFQDVLLKQTFLFSDSEDCEGDSSFYGDDLDELQEIRNGWNSHCGKDGEDEKNKEDAGGKESHLNDGRLFVGQADDTPSHKYTPLSSNSSTEGLKIMEREAVLRLSLDVSFMASDIKFSLNLNDLSLLKRRTSVRGPQ